MTKYATVKGTKRDAQRELRELLLSVDSGTHADSGRITVGAWLATWLQEAEHTVSPKTYERYREIVEKHLSPNLGAALLSKLKSIQVQDYYSKALKGGWLDGAGGLSPPNRPPP